MSYNNIKKAGYGWITKEALSRILHLNLYTNGDGISAEDAKQNNFYFEGSDTSGWFVLDWLWNGEEICFGVCEDSIEVYTHAEGEYIITKL